MHDSRLIAPLGLLLGVMLIGCSEVNKKGSDGSDGKKIQAGPNQVTVKVAGMT